MEYMALYPKNRTLHNHRREILHRSTDFISGKTERNKEVLGRTNSLLSFDDTDRIENQKIGEDMQIHREQAA
jgi:hypothetical protein